MEFPCQPRKETQQLCGVKVAAPRCCPQFTWQNKLHTQIVPDSSLIKCPTEHVKKIRARKMAIKYVKKSACFLRWRWRAVPHNPIKVTRRTEWRQLIINNCANAKSSRDLDFAPEFGDDSGVRVCICAIPFVGPCCPIPPCPDEKGQKKRKSTLSRKGATVGQSTPIPSHMTSTYVHSISNMYLPERHMHGV
ncbi:hypothetical protein TcCL_Unassigned04252 [Trypanosoma cruzi]|nr:hypothetical protein TcCL_Unassigned04252 [Trypanosoma cruzi]